MPARDRLLTTSGNVSLLPSSEVVKIIFCSRKSTSATAYRCPANEMHLKDSKRADVKTQGALPGAVLDGCPFCAFANNPLGFERTLWTTKMVSRNTTSE